MNSIPKNTSDVIVAGAGPVGLVAALVLAEAGVSVTVLEGRDRLNEASKASTFHPPTLEILDRLGAYSIIEKGAQHVGALQYRTTESGILGELSYDLLKGLTPHPYRKHFEQSKLTPVLLAKLREYPNAKVLFNAEVVAVEQDDKGVTVKTSSSAEAQTYSAGFLIGCDGAHSKVRQSVGIESEGKAYPGKVLRVRADESLQKILPGMAPVTYLVSETHSASFLHMPDCWRIILRIPADTTEETAMQDAWVLDKMQALIPGMKALPTVIGRDCYGASKRMASSYRAGRVFICGDSAHLTNTRGGMNMNCGIHDGYYVAKAMVKAVRDGDIDGLNAAAAERERIGKELLMPRTDTMVSEEGTWIERVNLLLSDKTRATNYLVQSAMLDMVDLSE